MMIFDLDGTLADCEHRRHFVDSSKNPNMIHGVPPANKGSSVMILRDYNKQTGEVFEPDWKAFYEACDKDSPIAPVIEMFNQLWKNRTGDGDIVIWSGRCESVRNKTENWLDKNLQCDETWPYLKMRPIGDNTPDDQLKERWLDELTVRKVYTMSGCMELKKDWTDFVLDSDPKSISMYRRKGIFVFDVNQNPGKAF